MPKKNKKNLKKSKSKDKAKNTELDNSDSKKKRISKKK